MLRRLLSSLLLRRHEHGRRDDSSGFTLIELLIVIAIMPIFLGTIALAMFTAARWNSQTGARVGAAADAQATASVFYQDAQSATGMTTSSQSQCGTGTVLFSVQWTDSRNQSITTSYVTDAASQTSATATLYRQVCFSANPTPQTTPVTSTLVATNVTDATITFPASYTQTQNPANGWVTTQGLSWMSLTIAETGQGNAFTMTATPSLNASSNGAG